ncbi:MAG: class I SAM-dependent methyltransferase [Myxococcales bacterium]|nr:class I SAM-dependent methyltransferase [Myxococcales bacterium]
MRTEQRIYSDQAELYALAFAYRDVDDEVSRLVGWARDFAGAEPQAALELAAGPADHALEFARRGARALALDLSPTMCRRAQESAAAAGVSVEVLCANMVDFRLARPVDLAFTLINSLAHLHTLDELISHFAAVREALAPGGLYVVELAHPGDFLGRGPRSTGVSQPWQVERDGVTLTTRWGLADDPYDPVRQLFSASVEFQVARDQAREVVHATVVMRDWTLDEIRAASRLAGGLTEVACFGDFEGGPVDGPDAWRAIFVFRRAP